jgi:hypothetical protein
MQDPRFITADIVIRDAVHRSMFEFDLTRQGIQILPSARVDVIRICTDKQNRWPYVMRCFGEGNPMVKSLDVVTVPHH